MESRVTTRYSSVFGHNPHKSVRESSEIFDFPKGKKFLQFTGVPIHIFSAHTHAPVASALPATQSPPCLPTSLFLFGQLGTLSSRGTQLFCRVQLREEGLRGAVCRKGGREDQEREEDDDCCSFARRVVRSLPLARPSFALSVAET